MMVSGLVTSIQSRETVAVAMGQGHSLLLGVMGIHGVVKGFVQGSTRSGLGVERDLLWRELDRGLFSRLVQCRIGRPDSRVAEQRRRRGSCQRRSVGLILKVRRDARLAGERA